MPGLAGWICVARVINKMHFMGRNDSLQSTLVVQVSRVGRRLGPQFSGIAIGGLDTVGR